MLVLQSPLSEYVLGNGHDDEIRLVEVPRCGELDLAGWLRVGMLIVECGCVSVVVAEFFIYSYKVKVVVKQKETSSKS